MGFLKKRDDEEVDPLDDILEGVDIIGTLINDMLPQMADDLAEMRERINQMDEGRPAVTAPAAYDSADFSEINERLDLLEQRFLAHEQTSLDRYSDLKEEINDLRLSVSSLHDRIEELIAWNNEEE